MAAGGITNDEAKALFDNLFAALSGTIEQTNAQFAEQKSEMKVNSDFLTEQLQRAKGEFDSLSQKQTETEAKHAEIVEYLNGKAAERDLKYSGAIAAHDAKLATAQDGDGDDIRELGDAGQSDDSIRCAATSRDGGSIYEAEEWR